MLKRPADCVTCSLHKIAAGFLPDLIPPDATLLFLGEAGGADEAASGRPFCGGTGNYLVALCRKAGLIGKLTKAEAEEEHGIPYRLLLAHGIGLGNILRCQPPRNRYPTGADKKSAEAHCRVYDGRTGPTLKAIDLSHVRVIVTFGQHAFKAISGQRKGTVGLWQNSVLPHRLIGEPRGNLWAPPSSPWAPPVRLEPWAPGIERTLKPWPTGPQASIWHVPTLHPAALMRDPHGWPFVIAALERAKMVRDYGWTPPSVRLIDLTSKEAVRTVLTRLAKESSPTHAVFCDIENSRSRTPVLQCMSFCLDPPTVYTLNVNHLSGEPGWEDMPWLYDQLRAFYAAAYVGFQHGMHDVWVQERFYGLAVKHWVADTCYLHSQAYSQLSHKLSSLQAMFTTLNAHKQLVRDEPEEAR